MLCILQDFSCFCDRKRCGIVVVWCHSFDVNIDIKKYTIARELKNK